MARFLWSQSLKIVWAAVAPASVAVAVQAGRPISSSGPQERALRTDGRRVWRTPCRPPAWPRAPFAVKIKTEQQKHYMTGRFCGTYRGHLVVRSAVSQQLTSKLFAWVRSVYGKLSSERLSDPWSQTEKEGRNRVWSIKRGNIILILTDELWHLQPRLPAANMIWTKWINCREITAWLQSQRVEGSSVRTRRAFTKPLL